MIELSQMYFESTADRSNIKDENERKFKDEAKIFDLSKYKDGVAIN